jgi:uncharacterized protein YecE (DUF72 family)
MAGPHEGRPSIALSPNQCDKVKIIVHHPAIQSRFHYIFARNPKKNRSLLRDAWAKNSRPISDGDFRRPNVNLYVGTSGYSYKQWKGTFYPRDLPNRRMLPFYGERFRTVEINNTFYRLPRASVLQAWAADVPADFQFALKAPQAITHRQRLKDAGVSLSQWLEVALALKERLGPLLFQLPPNFKKDVSRLRDFLALLPSERRVAWEFRHPSWFDEEVFKLLRDHQAALCIAEAENDLEVPFVATADWGYLRLRRPDYSDAEVRRWVKRLRKQDWQDVFVFFKHEDEGKGPRMAKRFLELAA